ncbi:FadR/GntR family transcriptional regulator [Paraburkholderia phenoliruptrix]|uniref:FadR/GntR family transcriptional regulator n=1 Tax=Paraburkholderia phenoliruptrix TaxID=252970 RepID=UPI001C6E1114|nr:FadR/GntR family transcriptional regulator [Paraburkholderia phenoliruptrix]MBW9106798.1 FadR family transcriptional regulator [Paraburkholderia phenoliruptrix]MBW9131813.1 FadR family transcriptional regulator [Paraburkholderia ginsengiterrae]
MKQTEPKRLYQSVAAQILSLIHQRELAAGTRLPPERELANTLGVSRPSLREALIALEIGGQIEIRMGSGVYVRDPEEGDDSTVPALGESPTELMQARMAVEGSVIVLAAGKLSAATLDKLRRTVERMKRLAAAGKSPVDADRQFHMLIAETAGNSVLSRFVAEMFDSRHDPIAAAIRDHSESPQTWSAAVREHEEILKALQAGDPIAAQTAMRSHLKASGERWITDELLRQLG